MSGNGALGLHPELANAGTAVPAQQQPKAKQGQIPCAAPPHPITTACRILLLMGLEGLSVGLFVWTLTHDEQLLEHVVRNALSEPERTSLLGAGLGTSGAMCGMALAYLLWRRSAALEPLARAAGRLAPLMLSAFIPLLLHWRLWDKRELQFSLLASAVALGAQPLFRMGLYPGPVCVAPEAGHRPATRWSWRGALAGAAGVRRRMAELGAAHANPVALLSVCVGIAGYAMYFSYYTIAHHHNLMTSSYDLAIWDNMVWNAWHGGPLLKSAPALGPEGSHLARHATFFAYVIAPFYALAPRAETLLVIQAVLIGAAALPLYGFAKRHVGVWPACAVAFLYLFYPPVHGANLYDFHFLPLAPFFLWSTVFLLETRRDRLAALAVILALSLREDVSAGLVILGGYLTLTGHRPKAGLLLAAVGACYAGLMALYVMPLSADGASFFAHEYSLILPEGERGYIGILKTVLGNPVFTLNSVLTERKLIYVLQIAAPLAFLPWRRPIGLLCSLPGFLFCLLATRPPFYQISFQYTPHWTIYLFVALVVNLAHVSRPLFEGDRLGGVRRKAWLAALGLAMLVNSHQFGAILQQNTARGGYGAFTFGTTPVSRNRYRALRSLIDLIPPDAKVVASEHVVPHLSNRPDAYTLRVGIFDAEYLLVELPVARSERSLFRGALAGGRYGVVAEKEGFVLAKRGHSTEANFLILALPGK